MTDPLRWLTASEYARRINRPYRTVLRWCLDGTFTAFHISTYQGPNRRWWIQDVPAYPPQPH